MGHKKLYFLGCCRLLCRTNLVELNHSDSFFLLSSFLEKNCFLIKSRFYCLLKYESYFYPLSRLFVLKVLQKRQVRPVTTSKKTFFDFFKTYMSSPRHIVLNGHLVGDPPPQKKGPFLGGGMFFWDRFVNFCPFDIKKILARLGDWADLLATYRPISGQFRPQIKIWNFKNMRFLLFLSKFWTFFFQMSES